MSELIVEVESFSDNGTHCSCTYKSKQFEMCIGTKGYGYTLTSGGLTDEEWDEVILKHYHGEYK